ncbi:MAG TPA: efflux transporter outer membrane subunit [Thermoanaerobaculia bacterium]|jgi:multidrug efflux system outer membrane protein|nr:efflux transporter outer membrane subunit [Thermoanaerobaculia bacterium]
MRRRALFPSSSPVLAVFAVLFVPVFLSGCVVGPKYQRPATTIPEQTRGQASPVEAGSLADQPWWEIFHDDALKSLIAEALKNGYDVRLAAWRVEEARANAGIANAQRFPAIQGQAEAGYGRQSHFSSSPDAQGGLIQLSVNASWEFDLFGRIRHLNEAALAEYLASEEARRGVFLSLVSDVATNYFQLRELDLQLEIAKRSSADFQETFDLFDRRLQGGAASALETSSAEASLASTAANIPDLERQIVAQENRLAFLLGRNPGSIARGAVLNDQFLPPDVPPGLPSDLLQRRPDLRQSEQNLIAANANVGVANADFFPRISLTGMLGNVSPQVSQLFPAGRTWTVGGGLLSPLFQGRRLHEQYRAAEARWEQAKVEYEQSVTNAFSEVSTALVAYQKLAEVEQQRARAVAADRQAAQIANQRYTAGLSSYLDVLQAQQQLYPAENLLAQARYNRLATLVQLYRALGGGWKLGDAQWPAGAGPETK